MLYFSLGILYYLCTFLITISSSSSDSVVQFLNVGQGDATYLHTPSHNILIDAGPSYWVDYHLFRLQGLGKCKIDLFVLTHPDKDHLNGLKKIAQRCEVSKIVSKTYLDHKLWSYIISDVLSPTTVIELPSKELMKYGDLSLRFFNLDTKLKNLNDSSIVTLIKYGDFDILLMGDLSSESFPSSNTLSQYITDNLDLFRFPHHGSKHSLNKDFISYFSPSFIVFSYGLNNSYGHPSPEVLEFLQDFDQIYVLETPSVNAVSIKLPKLYQ